MIIFFFFVVNNEHFASLTAFYVLFLPFLSIWQQAEASLLQQRS